MWQQWQIRNWTKTDYLVDCAKIMGKTSDKMRRILEEFLELGMLKKEGETFLIKNWDKYQSIDKYENYQIQNRERQRKYREKLKK